MGGEVRQRARVRTKNQNDQARTSLQSLIAEQPHRPAPHRHLARIAQKINDLNTTRYHLQRYLQLGGADTDGQVKNGSKNIPQSRTHRRMPSPTSDLRTASFKRLKDALRDPVHHARRNSYQHLNELKGLEAMTQEALTEAIISPAHSFAKSSLQLSDLIQPPPTKRELPSNISYHYSKENPTGSQSAPSLRRRSQLLPPLLESMVHATRERPQRRWANH